MPTDGTGTTDPTPINSGDAGGALAGAAVVSLASTGALLGWAALAGSSSIGVGSSGRLATPVLMGGSAALRLTSSAAIASKVALSGAARVAFDAGGDLGGGWTDGVAFLAFGLRDEGLLWVRANGAIDATEWDPTARAYIEGPNRDGGLPMPEGYWESARIPGAARRLTRVEIERDGFAALSIVGFTDRLDAGEASFAPKGQRWGRFSPRLQGRTFRLRVRVPESLGGVAGFDMVFDPLAGPGR